MKEWQKLLFNAIFNIAAALIVGGFLKLMLDFKSIIASVVVVIMKMPTAKAGASTIRKKRLAI